MSMKKGFILIEFIRLRLKPLHEAIWGLNNPTWPLPYHLSLLINFLK